MKLEDIKAPEELKERIKLFLKTESVGGAKVAYRTDYDILDVDKKVLGKHNNQPCFASIYQSLSSAFARSEKETGAQPPAYIHIKPFAQNKALTEEETARWCEELCKLGFYDESPIELKEKGIYFNLNSAKASLVNFYTAGVLLRYLNEFDFIVRHVINLVDKTGLPFLAAFCYSHNNVHTYTNGGHALTNPANKQTFPLGSLFKLNLLTYDSNKLDSRYILDDYYKQKKNAGANAWALKPTWDYQRNVTNDCRLNLNNNVNIFDERLRPLYYEWSIERALTYLATVASVDKSILSLFDLQGQVQITKRQKEEKENDKE